MSDDKNKTLRMYVFRVGAPLLLLISLLIISYTYTFGCSFPQLISSDWTCLSKSSDTWGQFGDFFGGTLNPVLASITLFVVLWTSNEQMKFIKLETVSLQANSHVIDLKHAIENVKNELNRQDDKTLSTGIVRKELTYLANLCDSCLKENPNDPITAGVNYLADSIAHSASMLSIHCIVLEEVLLKSKGETSASYRLSLVSSCFEQHSEILGLMYLIEVKFNKEFIRLDKTLDI